MVPLNLRAVRPAFPSFGGSFLILFHDDQYMWPMGVRDLFVRPPPQVHMWKSSSQSVSTQRWGLWGVIRRFAYGACVNGISALI